MSLTDSKIRATKPSPTPFKLTASHGLYLCLSVRAVPASGISNIISTEKNTRRGG